MTTTIDYISARLGMASFALKGLIIAGRAPVAALRLNHDEVSDLKHAY